jgi:hypothetical protein
MAVILIATAVYSIHNRHKVTEDFTIEMKDLIQEATVLKKDLEAMMENTMLVSDEMIKSLDMRLDQLENLTVSQGRGVVTRNPQSISERPSKKTLPFTIEDLRRAHPSIIVPRLWNDGYSIPEIAELLDRGQGEVRLILDIQERREISS